MIFRKLRRSKRGIETVTAVLMLLLMFTALTILIVSFSNSNISAQEQMDLEHQRAQEKIELTNLEVNDAFEIIGVLVNNTGTIEVEIRAIYEITAVETKFLFDPADYGDAHIAPASSLLIDVPTNVPEIAFDPEAKIVAATERGTKNLDYVPALLFGTFEPPSNYDPTKLYIGPLMLKFDEFACHKTNGQGILNPASEWQPGWVVSEKGYYAWKITIMNIDDRDITINRFASFNLVPSESPSSTLSWYLDPTDLNGKQLLQVNQTVSVTYKWTAPLSGAAQRMNFPECTCMVFLTFFGVFHEADGTETPYAQTIPFEASVTVTA